MNELLIVEAIRIAYPDAIKKGLSGLFYWTNIDGDWFSFDTFDEAAIDLAQDIGMDEDEARRVIRAGRAVS